MTVGRIQFALTTHANAFEVKRAVLELQASSQLPAKTTVAAWEWQPLRGITAIAVESDSFAHLAPWQRGDLPGALPLHIMPAAWWIAQDIGTLGRMVQDALRGATDPRLVEARH